VLLENLQAVEAQNAARAALDAFPTSQAARVGNMLSQPGVAANVYADGAIERANTALHAARRFRHNVPGK
jgi:hypothetical protein